MSFLYPTLRSIRKICWIMLVAYMLGLHNVYKEVEENPDDVVYKIEDHHAQEDDEPKV